jgi:hypothetical protein
MLICPWLVGEVANQDILAPYSITYESKVYTERVVWKLLRQSHQFISPLIPA